MDICMVQRAGKIPCEQKEEVPIIFTEEDSQGVSYPYDDPVVVTLVLANFKTRRILIDNDNSSDILFLHAFDQLKVGRKRLRSVQSPFVGFTGATIYPKGQIALPITMGEEGNLITHMVDFLVVDSSSAYNAILGRVFLNKARAMVSTYRLKEKFPTLSGVGEVRGDQKSIWECHNLSLKSPDILTIDNIDMRDKERLRQGEPDEELDEIELEANHRERKVKIGSALDQGVRADLIQFLRENKEVFAWSHEDMPGIDRRIIAHRLNVNPVMRPIKQKKRNFSPERNKAAANEVDKLITVG